MNRHDFYPRPRVCYVRPGRAEVRADTAPEDWQGGWRTPSDRKTPRTSP